MENRTNNCKTSNQTSGSSQSQSSNRTANNSTNSTGEHKHPNQYTKGADDESARNASHTSAKNSR